MDEKATIDGVQNKPPGLLLSLSLLVLLLLLAYQLRLSYGDQVKTAEISSYNLAAIFETRLEATLRRTDADLQIMAIEIPFASLNRSAVYHFEREVRANLERMLFNVEEMTGYRVHDADGDLLYAAGDVATLCDSKECLNVSKRDYFQRLRDDPEAGLVFSDVLTDRRTGREVLVIARGIRDDQGNFLGIVRGLLELEYYRKQFQ